MRIWLPIAALLACACTAERADAPAKVFETFTWGAQDYYCTFYPADAELDGLAREELPLIFTTIFDDPNNEARVKFGGETLRLVPQTELGTLPAPTDVTYTVTDYSKFEVKVSLTPVEQLREGTRYKGRIEMLGLDASADIKGSCGV